MKNSVTTSIVAMIISICFFSSCTTLERASLHGLHDGFYTLTWDETEPREVYVEVFDDSIRSYPSTNHQPQVSEVFTIPLNEGGNIPFHRLTFKKQGLDIDISTVLMKYRPTIGELPAQLTTDLNLALYTGWRYDYFPVKQHKDPLGSNVVQIENRGFDFGIFAGPGTTLISPFTTRNRRSDEYNGMIMQAGLAGFIETNLASFGIAVGYDYLLSSDRSIWIYHNKPWVGFMIGVALN